MNSQNHADSDIDSRANALKRLRARLRCHGTLNLTASETKLLDEAIFLMEEKEAEETRRPPAGGHKPFFLSLVTVLGGVVSFAMPTMMFWQTSITPALIASAIGLAVGIAAVKLDPGYKGHWLHDVD